MKTPSNPTPKATVPAAVKNHLRIRPLVIRRFRVHPISGLLLLLAVWADAVEIQPMADVLVARLPGYLLGHLLHQVVGHAHVRVDDLPAADTDEVRVGIGSATVVAVVVVAEAKL
jgi:hypothetical protein